VPFRSCSRAADFRGRGPYAFGCGSLGTNPKPITANLRDNICRQPDLPMSCNPLATVHMVHPPQRDQRQHKVLAAQIAGCNDETAQKESQSEMISRSREATRASKEVQSAQFRAYSEKEPRASCSQTKVPGSLTAKMGG